ncbi:hypothetical protein [Haloarchaeobius sp. DFWS5]|uniref:hypothetical protein n=1 Tax=Haloarchaeobius sp. DFWS5 TaxID=3446114 RepID=UPI003EBE60B6
MGNIETSSTSSSLTSDSDYDTKYVFTVAGVHTVGIYGTIGLLFLTNSTAVPTWLAKGAVPLMGLLFGIGLISLGKLHEALREVDRDDAAGLEAAVLWYISLTTRRSFDATAGYILGGLLILASLAGLVGLVLT